jgi:ribokinase
MKKSQRGRVTVVGSSNTDLVVNCAVLPRPGETVLGNDLLTFAGGKGANQAVAAARAGADVRFIGAFGDDAFGAARRADLEREGIDCSGCVTKKGVASGVALIGIGKGEGNARAENLIIVAGGANSRLTPADVRRGMPRDLGRSHSGRPDVVLCSLEVPIDAVIEAMTLAEQRGAGVVVILNPAPFPDAAGLKKLLRHAHYVTPNETEFEGIVGAKIGSPSAARKCARIARAHFLVTRGPRGVDAYIAGRYHGPYAAAPKVTAIDTVGAGDCFNGCLAAALTTENGECLNAVRFAVTAAALKVTRQGAQAGMPRLQEIRARLRK